jgi:hypothetical protein
MSRTGIRFGELVGLEKEFVRPKSIRVEWQLDELGSGKFAQLVDVARLAGTFTGTVSNVFNRPETVPDGARNRVEKAAAQLGYIPGGMKASTLASHWRRSSFATWIFQPASTGWYPRTVPFPPRPVPILGDVWTGIPARGRGASGRTDACWLLIAKGLTPHGLRHSHKTAMQELGVPSTLQDDRMGHADGSVQARYSHITVAMRQRLMNELTEQWEANFEAARLCHPAPQSRLCTGCSKSSDDDHEELTDLNLPVCHPGDYGKCMGFLTSLLPGIRDLRTPMSCGLLWLGVLILAFATKAHSIVAEGKQTTALLHFAKSWPSSLLIPLTLAAAYLVGAILSPVTVWVITTAGDLLFPRLWTILRSDESRTSLRRRVAARLKALVGAYTAVDTTARSLIVGAVNRTLGRAGAPGAACLAYPYDFVFESIRYTAPYLAVTAPVLHQDYDRLRSEVELRLSIVPPLLLGATLSPLNGKVWLVAAVSIGCIILLGQAVLQKRASINVLANAAYVDQVPIPSVKAVADQLEELQPKPTSDGAWIGAILLSLELRGFFEETSAMIDELVDFNVDTLRETMKYLRQHNDELFDTLLRRIASLKSFSPEQDEDLSKLFREFTEALRES